MNESLSVASRPFIRKIFYAILLTLVYFIAGRFGFWLGTTAEGFAAPVWPPAGIAIAALVLGGVEYAPAIWLGAFLVNVTNGGGFAVSNFLMSGMIAIGNLLEALSVAVFLPKILKFSFSFDCLSDVTGYISASTLGPVISATVGLGALLLFSRVHGLRALSEGWVTWWVGDVLGALVVAPLIIALCRPSSENLSFSKSHPFQPATLPLVIVAVGVLGLSAILPGSIRHFSLAFVVYSGLIWCSIRFSMRTFFISMGVVAAVSIFSAYHGLGPFSRPHDRAYRLFLLQFFLGCGSATMMLLHALVSERFSALETVHRRELALIDAEKMSAIGEVTSGMAHEINNPLAAICANAEQLKMMCESEQPPRDEILTIVKRIDSAAMRVAKVVRSLLFFARHSEHDPKTTVSVASVVQDALELL